MYVVSVGADYQLGAARVFIREALHRALERARADKLRAAATKLQAHFRGYLARYGLYYNLPFLLRLFYCTNIRLLLLILL